MRAFAEGERAVAAARRCGLDTMGDFSAKFEGFKPGLYVVVGSLRTRQDAERALAQVRPCVPDAFLRAGTYAGE